MAILLAHSAARLGRATTVQCTCTPLARREREMSRDAATKDLLAWTATSERTPGAQNDEGGKIRGLLALGQEQRAVAISFRLSAINEQYNLVAEFAKIRSVVLDSEFLRIQLRLSPAQTASSNSLRIRSSRTRFTRRRDASNTVTRTVSCHVIVSPGAGTRPNSAKTKPPIVSKSAFSGRSKSINSLISCTWARPNASQVSSSILRMAASAC